MTMVINGVIESLVKYPAKGNNSPPRYVPTTRKSNDLEE
jgi:hypothetical protein